MLRPVKVKALSGYRLWLEYSDGVSGEVDLSNRLDHDYYKEWKIPGVFDEVRIVCYDLIVWDDDSDVNPRDLYMEITGKSREEPATEFRREVTPQTVRPVKVQPLPGYRLWLEYSDGVNGEVDVSDMVGTDRHKPWDAPGSFEKVRIEYFDTLLWNDGLGMNPYDLYMKITGKSYDDLPAEIQDLVTPPGDYWRLKVVDVKTLPGYRILVEFNDGVRGQLDLSGLVGKSLFKSWDVPGYFDKVRVTSYGTIAWDDDLEFCAESMYMDITGKSWEALPGHASLSVAEEMATNA